MKLIIILFGVSLYTPAYGYKSCHDHESVKKLKNDLLISKTFGAKNVDGNNMKTEIPATFDWRTVRTLSPIKNQHLPEWCGSCWAHSAASTMTDRIYISRGDTFFDPFYISVQEIISCGNT